MAQTLKDVQDEARRKLQAMFPEIHRLTMLSVVDWTEHDIYTAQAALCYIASTLATAPDSDEDGP